MSAFMCSDDHIIALAAYAVKSQHVADTLDCLRFHVSTLHAENLKSVMYRYEDIDPDTYPLPVATGKDLSAADGLSPVQIIKMCHCLDYQSCEHPEYEHSAACRIIREIIDVASFKLPGYDEAAWAYN
jgi:hypothetical protein